MLLSGFMSTHHPLWMLCKCSAGILAESGHTARDQYGSVVGAELEESSRLRWIGHNGRATERRTVPRSRECPMWP